MNRFAPIFAASACLIVSMDASAQYTLWDPATPVPTTSQATLLSGVNFELIKPHQPEIDGEEWLHGGTIIKHEGVWHVTWGSNTGAENTATEVTKSVRSYDNLQTFTAPETIASGTTVRSNSHGVTYSHNGELWGFFGGFEGFRQNTQTDIYKFNETTEAWESQSVSIGNDFWAYDAPQLMDNGNYVMGGFRMSADGSSSNNYAAVAISDGSDLTDWSVVTMPNTPGGFWGESSVIVDGDNLTNIVRANGANAWAYVSTSTDNGQTWTDVEQSNLPMAATKPYAGTLSTGQDYLISTTTADSGNERDPLTIALTDVGGGEFTQIYRIRNGVLPNEDFTTDADLAYPYAVEEDGNLYVVYSMGRPGNSNNGLEMAVVPLTSLVQSPMAVNNNENLIAIYDFEGNTLDSSGNESHGNATGTDNYLAAPDAIAGRSDRVIDLGGSTGVSLDTDFIATANETGATLSFWIQTSESVSQDAAYAFSAGNSGDNTPIYGIQIDPDDNSLARLVFRPDGSSTLSTATGTAEVFGDGWHHLVLVDDGEVMRLYVDGVLDATLDYDETATLTSDLNALGMLDRQSPFGYLTGQLDEATIFNRVLSDHEIGQLASGVDPRVVPEPTSLTALLLTLGLAMRRRPRCI